MRINIKEIKKINSRLKSVLKKDELPLVTGVAMDSRLVQQGDLFIPLKGVSTDGHNYIQQAIENGAGLIVSETNNNSAEQVINVTSTWQFLRDLTYAWRSSFSCPFLGITGTNGKTTSKELLCHVLENSMQVLKTMGNFNSTTGVPLSMFSFSSDADCCIIEMGASEPGEIAAICGMAQPGMGLITNIGEAHIEYFGSREKIAETKAALFTTLPKNGTALVNLDDPFIAKMDVPCKKVTYAFNSPAEFKGSWTTPGQFAKFSVNGTAISLPVQSESLGKNALAVFAAASQFGISPEKIAQRMQSFLIPCGRGEIVNLDNIRLINDSYNANLDSARAGIIYLVSMKSTNRKIAVIGDMLELGALEKQHHIDLGRLLNDKAIDAVFAYGKLTEFTIKAMNGTAKFHQFYEDKSMMIKDLKNYITQGDIIYLKGSRSMKMEEIIEGLKD